MRNTIAMLALLISISGIFVSLAREELRCKLGLNSLDCSSTSARKAPNQDNQSSFSRPKILNQDSAPSERNKTEEKSTEIYREPFSASQEISTTDTPRTEITGNKVLKPGVESSSGTNRNGSVQDANSVNASPIENAKAAPDDSSQESSPMDLGQQTNDSNPSQTPLPLAPDGQPIPVIPPSP